MIIALTERYQLLINSPLHWGLVLLALLGVMSSCGLIYRRFSAKPSGSRQKNSSALQREKLHFALLILGNGVFFISVLLFVLPIQAKTTAASFDVLLTPGFMHVGAAEEFNLAKVDNKQIHQALALAKQIWLLDEHAKGSNYLGLSQAVMTSYRDKIIVINSLAELTALWASASHRPWHAFAPTYHAPPLLKIFGDGLTDLQWQPLLSYQQDSRQQQANQQTRINQLEFAVFASKLQTGVVDLSWQRQLTLGQALTVTGRLQQPITDSQQFQLSLVHHNHVLDSVIIAKDEPFSLTTTSKAAGLFTYQLQLSPLPEILTSQAPRRTPRQEGRGESISEEIAVSVINDNQTRVLIKQSSPSFETRRLKQWLAQTHSQVLVISQISKNKWAQQQVNSVRNKKDDGSKISDSDDFGASAEESIGMQGHLLNANLLAKHDLVIMDSRALLALENHEIKALYNAVSKGLGLLIYADETLLQAKNNSVDKLNKLLNLFTISSAEPSLAKVIALWPDKPKLALSQVISRQTAAIAITAKPGQGIVGSTSGQALVVKHPVGLGTVAISALNQTYQWSVQVTPAFYSHYWQYLLSQTARSANNTRWLSPMPTELAQVKQYQVICLISPPRQVESPVMALTAYPLSSDKKCARVSAEQKGWVELQAFDDNQELLAMQARYFYDRTDFLPWQQARKHQVSAKYTNSFSLASDKLSTGKYFQAIDKRYLWLIMFISLSLLWFERKWQSA